MKKAQLIKPSGKYINIAPKDGKMFTLKELQNLVGGYIEIPFETSKGTCVICDEEGILKNKPINRMATDVVIHSGIDVKYYLVGDVLLCPRELLE